MKKRYEVFAGLYEDSNAGWIWMPPGNGFTSRDYITIKAISTGKKVSCTCRIIDDNFLFSYNQPSRRCIDDVDGSIVIADYYRKKLGKLRTGEAYEFEIVRVADFDIIHRVKAYSQHPDSVVKLAMFLAFWSVLLGAIGIILGAIGVSK